MDGQGNVPSANMWSSWAPTKMSVDLFQLKEATNRDAQKTDYRAMRRQVVNDSNRKQGYSFSLCSELWMGELCVSGAFHCIQGH